MGMCWRCCHMREVAGSTPGLDFSSFSRHKLFKEKFTWKSQYILSLDYKRPKSEPNSPIAPTWRNVTSNRVRQLRWMCGLCMNQRHSVTHVVQRGKTETYGPKFLFLASIYRFVCRGILCIVHKWNLSVWSYVTSPWFKQSFICLTWNLSNLL
jgi:hypothetical protein